MSSDIGLPGADEYAPYYHRYVRLVQDTDACAALAAQLADTVALAHSIGEEAAGEPYAPGKWTVKDVICHLADTERVMSYRALRIARGDATPLASFEQDDYVRGAGATGRPLAELVAELTAVRGATIALCRTFDAAALARRGTASGWEVSVRALVYIIAGHERHHQGILQQASAATDSSADDRRTRGGLRVLVDDMMTQIRTATSHDAWTAAERARAEEDLARIMGQVRHAALAQPDEQ